MENSIREIQIHICDALEQWAKTMAKAEYENRAFMLHYKEKDLFNAVYILSHVLSNIGTHNGTISENNVEEVGMEIRKFVHKFSGLDSTKLIKGNGN